MRGNAFSAGDRGTTSHIAGNGLPSRKTSAKPAHRQSPDRHPPVPLFHPHSAYPSLLPLPLRSPPNPLTLLHHPLANLKGPRGTQQGPTILQIASSRVTQSKPVACRRAPLIPNLARRTRRPLHSPLLFWKRSLRPLVRRTPTRPPTAHPSAWVKTAAPSSGGVTSCSSSIAEPPSTQPARSTAANMDSSWNPTPPRLPA